MHGACRGVDVHVRRLSPIGEQLIGGVVSRNSLSQQCPSATVGPVIRVTETGVDLDDAWLTIHTGTIDNNGATCHIYAQVHAEMWFVPVRLSCMPCMRNLITYDDLYKSLHYHKE